MTKEDYFEGILKSLSNSNDLFEDAEILYNSKKYPRAYTLYQLSIEEIGKVSLIYDFIISKDLKNEQERFKKKFLSHKIKTENSIGLDLLLAFNTSDKKDKSRLVNQVYEQEKRLREINELKNSSLYTDIKNDKFLLPKEVIKIDATNKIRSIALERLRFAQKFYKIGISNFEEIKKASKEIDKENMMNNPPDEIIELLNLKYNIKI